MKTSPGAPTGVCSAVQQRENEIFAHARETRRAVLGASALHRAR